MIGLSCGLHAFLLPYVSAKSGNIPIQILGYTHTGKFVKFLAIMQGAQSASGVCMAC